jgi:DNA polymerase I
MMIADLPFREVWAADFEFAAPGGERPKPICLVARELKTRRTVRQWEDEFGPLPPYSTDPDSLFVAFYASAEFGCHLALGWPMPERILDLFAEHRCLTNGVPTGYGNSLLGALAYHGLDGLGADEKSEMRALAMRGGPWTNEEPETYSTTASPTSSL